MFVHRHLQRVTTTQWDIKQHHDQHTTPTHTPAQTYTDPPIPTPTHFYKPHSYPYKLHNETVYNAMMEVSATGWSIVQRSLVECDVPECNREVLIMRRPWPTRGFAPWNKRLILNGCLYTRLSDSLVQNVCCRVCRMIHSFRRTRKSFTSVTFSLPVNPTCIFWFNAFCETHVRRHIILLLNSPWRFRLQWRPKR